MPGVKKLIIESDKITTLIPDLSLNYNHISIFLHPHPRHLKQNLYPTQALIIAWNHKSRPDKRKP